jgi:hypothetical protein
VHHVDVVDAALTSFGDVDVSWLEAAAPDDWALGSDALRFTTRLVELAAPGNVLELGSGRSTRLLARLARSVRPAPRITTLENDPEVVRRTKASLRSDRTRPAVDLRYAPVVVRRCEGRQVPVYHLDRPVPPPEIVLVDGPPKPLGGREGALYQAVGLAVPGALILLDDADRDSEVEALANVRRAFGDRVLVRRLDGFPKGLAMIEVLTRTEVTMEIDPGSRRHP